jgi:hypothetical protein
MEHTMNTKTQVELALAKSGYTASFLSARLVRQTDVEEVHEVAYYNDDGDRETGFVYVERSTGKGEF